MNCDALGLVNQAESKGGVTREVFWALVLQNFGWTQDLVQLWAGDYLFSKVV